MANSPIMGSPSSATFNPQPALNNASSGVTTHPSVQPATTQSFSSVQPSSAPVTPTVVTAAPAIQRVNTIANNTNGIINAVNTNKANTPPMTSTPAPTAQASQATQDAAQKLINQANEKTSLLLRSQAMPNQIVNGVQVGNVQSGQGTTPVMQQAYTYSGPQEDAIATVIAANDYKDIPHGATAREQAIAHINGATAQQGTSNGPITVAQAEAATKAAQAKAWGLNPDGTWSAPSGTTASQTGSSTQSDVTSTGQGNTSTGTTQDQTGTATGSQLTPGGLPYQGELDRLNTESDNLHAQYMQDLEKLRNGTYPLTESQDAQLLAVKQSFDSLLAQQKVANENYTQGMTKAGINAGRNRYAPEVELGNIKSTVDSGLKEIADLNTKSITTLYQIKDAIQQENWKMMDAAYTKLDQFNQEKQKKFDDLQKFTLDRADKLEAKNRQATLDKQAADAKNAVGYAAALVHVGPKGDVVAPTPEEIDAKAKELDVNPAALQAEITKRTDELNKQSLEERKQTNAEKVFQIGTDINGNKIFGQRNDDGSISKVNIDGSTPAGGSSNLPAGSQFGDLSGSTINKDGTVSVQNGNGASITLDASDASFLSQLSKQQRDLAQRIADYKADPSSVASLRGNARTQLIQAAQILNPSFDMNLYQQRQKTLNDFAGGGKDYTNIKALNTAVGHLAELKQAADALKNRGATFWNALANGAESTFGDPRVVQFNTAANAVAGEMANIFKNSGGTDSEIRAWREQLSSSSSPAQLSTGINTLIDLMGSRLNAIKDSYKSVMNEDLPFPVLSPTSQKTLQDIGVNLGESQTDVNKQKNDFNSRGFNQTYDDAVKKYGVDGLQKILEQNKNSFNQVSGDTNTAASPADVTSSIKSVKNEGEWGGQCGEFIHNFVSDYPHGLNGINQKESVINVPKGSTPQVGDVVIQRVGGQYGHVSIVNSVDPRTGKITLTESNYYDKSKPEKVTNNRKLSIDDPTISGYFRGKLKI